MTVLVTGARGFAGSHLLASLSQNGVAATGWSRQDVDLLDPRAVTRAIAELKPTVVYHCAGASHVGQSFANVRDTLASNVLGTHHLLKGLHSAGLGARVLIPSSSLVYRQSDLALQEDDPIGPATPYALSKLAQEMLGRRSVLEDGQQIFIARPFNHTGPRQNPSFSASGFARQIALIEQGRMSPEISVGNLDASRDLHDVRDTVRAYRAIVEHGRPGEVYNVCSGQAFKIRDVLDRLIAISRVPATVRVDPSRYRQNDNPVLFGDRAKIQSEVGWTPTIPLEQTLADLLDYWRMEVNNRRT
ncbi:MAG TPA: GDP-mannose 4,6-dehydratase [Vicinamibacterales bacterium]|nr:GDP-mannose 4,6-dehydratase [Vicinamibacterales bacterium]